MTEIDLLRDGQGNEKPKTGNRKREMGNSRQKIHNGQFSVSSFLSPVLRRNGRTVLVDAVADAGYPTHRRLARASKAYVAQGPTAPKLARRIASPRLAELASTDLAQALAAQPAPKRSEQDSATIWEQLIALPLAAEYQRAFVSATGLPLRFAPTAGLAELERLSGPHCTLVGLPGCQAD